ncbi:MAG: hypothetical protein JZU53_16450 [Paludibacter sp.]|nr:hypothetical protein [Paludibacter sp.]
MDSLTITSFFLIALPVIFLVALFIGIVKKNKRLWLTSLIFLLVILFAEGILLTLNTTFRKTNTSTIQRTR